jgi:hypothetical protein
MDLSCLAQNAIKFIVFVPFDAHQHERNVSAA